MLYIVAFQLKVGLMVEINAGMSIFPETENH